MRYITFLCVLVLTATAFADSGDRLRKDLESAVDDELAVAGLIQRADALRREGKLEDAEKVLLSAGEDNFYQPAVYRAYMSLASAAATKGNNRVADSDSSLPVLYPAVTSAERNAFSHKAAQRPGFPKAALARLRANEGLYRREFRSVGIPEELIYIGLVESGYDANAVSRAGAVGVWQFVPATASRYGLRRFGNLDERKDPVKSARAAALYLRDLKSLFGDRPLALAAYNAGEYRILRIIGQTGTKDFWELRRRGALPRETADYVPSVLAAAKMGASVYN